MTKENKEHTRFMRIVMDTQASMDSSSSPVKVVKATVLAGATFPALEDPGGGRGRGGGGHQTESESDEEDARPARRVKEERNLDQSTSTSVPGELRVIIKTKIARILELEQDLLARREEMTRMGHDSKEEILVLEERLKEQADIKKTLLGDVEKLKEERKNLLRGIKVDADTAMKTREQIGRMTVEVGKLKE